MSTRDLVDAMFDGKSIEMETEFNACVAERVAGTLEQIKMDLAQNMFNNQEQTEDQPDEE